MFWLPTVDNVLTVHIVPKLHPTKAVNLLLRPSQFTHFRLRCSQLLNIIPHEQLIWSTKPFAVHSLLHKLINEEHMLCPSHIDCEHLV